MINSEFTDVPKGKIATVVTHLEMLAQVPTKDITVAKGVLIKEMNAPDLLWYRDLYRRVGAEEWLWFSRLQMPDQELSGIIHDPLVHVYSLNVDGVDQGLLELDFRCEDECELAFFGVTPEMIGGGVGRYLMNNAIERAWAAGITRFHVHTCTLDHPAALGFYIRSGFTPISRQVEILDDPRLAGLLPMSAGSHIPIIG